MLATQSSTVADPNPETLSAESRLAWKRLITPAEPFLQAVADRLREQISAFERDIAVYAEYALTNQGKQLRPALVALSGGATGKVDDQHVLAAVIIEMVHLATLVHDDVMDEASLRRGRPTLAANWGNEISVLLGDCLFAHALKMAASFPTTEMCRAVSAATNTVCSGEILQTQRRRNFELSRAEYFKAIQMKTGELFALSCDLGAYLSGAGAVQRTALRQYGMAIGTAYQIYDDCLDLFGSEAVAGKSLGTDLAKGKLTLPVLIALERAPAPQRSELRVMLQQWEWDPRRFAALLGVLHSRGALEGSCQVVHEHLAAGRQKLTTLPESQSRQGLSALADYLADQTDALALPA
jgi:octaprenyl-diphosphate synthase